MAEDTVLIYLGLVFAAVFLLSQVMIVPAFGDSRQARKRLKKRVEEIEKISSEDGVASLLRERYLRKLSPLERQLEAIPALASLRRLIEQGGHQILAYRFVLLAVVIGIASAIVTWTVTRMPTAALGVGLLGLWLPFVKISRDRYQTLSKFEEQLPDAIDVMRRALMAGHPFNATLRLVAEDSGGNLAEILEQIAKVVRERFRFQRRVRTLSAEGRMSAWILALIPLFLVVAMMTGSPDYLPMLFEDPMGRRMVMFAIAWAAIGVFFIRRIIRIEV